MKATFEDHPTDPDKVILRKPRHEDDDDIQEYKKPWVDLTDDEMLMIYGQDHEGKKYNLGRMVQQALKEKNT